MKKRLVQTITENNNTYGQVSNPQDLIKAQDFLHDRLNELTRDFISDQGAEIVGFNYTLAAGNARQITVAAPGRVYSGGKSYHLPGNKTLNIAPANQTLPRLDLIVAVLEDDVDTAMALIPFVRLRTADEFADGINYPPQNFNAPTENHCRAVVQIKTGTPALNPVAPTVNSNEIPLYLITVAPGTLPVVAANVSDLRRHAKTLRQLSDINAADTDLSDLRALVNSLVKLGDFSADFGSLFGGHTTLKNILQQLQTQANAARELPDIRYDVPKVSLANKDSSKIVATGAVSGGVPVVDIEIGGRINFGGSDVVLQPDRFPASVNARLESIGGGAASDSNELALTLGNVTLLDSDGSLGFGKRAAEFAVARQSPAAAARDGRYIEVFGGANAAGSPLSDWLTYDTINDTLTPRQPSAAFPVIGGATAFSCGDGIHILLMIGDAANLISPEEAIPATVFKINADTGTVTPITTNRPAGATYFGDLIAPGKIFIVACDNGFPTFWEYTVAADTFAQLSPTGGVPLCRPAVSGGCTVGENSFVVHTTGYGTTHLFDRTNLLFTQLPIAQPYSDQPGDVVHNFRMANVGGRPVLIGSTLFNHYEGKKAKIWELATVGTLPSGSKQYEWRQTAAIFAPVQSPGFCSTIQNGLARGAATIFGGGRVFSPGTKEIYSSVQSGLVYAQYRGEPAITIADGSTFARFVIPVYNAAWDVAGYLLNLRGSFTESNLKVEVSFNGGTTYLPIKPDQYAAITNSSAPGVRHLRFTLYNLQSNKPVLAKLFEFFDQDGQQLENRLVIRYNAPNATQALYVNSFGVVTLSPVIEPSTPGKCLLHKITPNGSNAPAVKNYINRRRPHVKYGKVKSGAADSVQFDNELAVPVRYLDCRAFKADKTLYKIDEVNPTFDGVINVTGVATNGDTWIVELEG